jgi:hypothetical protein
LFLLALDLPRDDAVASLRGIDGAALFAIAAAGDDAALAELGVKRAHRGVIMRALLQHFPGGGAAAAPAEYATSTAFAHKLSLPATSSTTNTTTTTTNEKHDDDATGKPTTTRELTTTTNDAAPLQLVVARTAVLDKHEKQLVSVAGGIVTGLLKIGAAVPLLSGVCKAADALLSRIRGDDTLSVAGNDMADNVEQLAGVLARCRRVDDAHLPVLQKMEDTLVEAAALLSERAEKGFLKRLVSDDSSSLQKLQEAIGRNVDGVTLALSAETHLLVEDMEDRGMHTVIRNVAMRLFWKNRITGGCEDVKLRVFVSLFREHFVNSAPPAEAAALRVALAKDAHVLTAALDSNDSGRTDVCDVNDAFPPGESPRDVVTHLAETEHSVNDSGGDDDDDDDDRGDGVGGVVAAAGKEGTPRKAKKRLNNLDAYAVQDTRAAAQLPPMSFYERAPEAEVLSAALTAALLHTGDGDGRPLRIVCVTGLAALGGNRLARYVARRLFDARVLTGGGACVLGGGVVVIDWQHVETSEVAFARIAAALRVRVAGRGSGRARAAVSAALQTAKGRVLLVFLRAEDAWVDNDAQRGVDYAGGGSDGNEIDGAAAVASGLAFGVWRALCAVKADLAILAAVATAKTPAETCGGGAACTSTNNRTMSSVYLAEIASEAAALSSDVLQHALAPLLSANAVQLVEALCARDAAHNPASGALAHAMAAPAASPMALAAAVSWLLLF